MIVRIKLKDSQFSPKTDLMLCLASFIDHARDLLLMINQFRADMPMPIVGIGHSMGGSNLVNLALMHPRLLSTLILLDPVIQGFEGFQLRGKPQTFETFNEFRSMGLDPARASTYRRDLWPSRDEAAAAFRKSKFYQTWDRRVLNNWIKYGLRNTPTLIYPNASPGSVTLTTTKHQEVFSYMRPTVTEGERAMDLPLELQILPVAPSLYKPESSTTMARMPNLRPSTLFIFGAESSMSTPALQKEKLEKTGMGVGGSGGAKEGRVKGISLDRIGHLVAMEAVEQCADATAPWLGEEVMRWKREAGVYDRWARNSQIFKTTISEERRRIIGGPLTKRPDSAKI